MAVLDNGSGADDADSQFALPRCHFEVLQSDILNVYLFKTKKFRTSFRFSVGGANEYRRLLKIILDRDHGGWCTDPLHALLPCFLAAEYLNFHPQIVYWDLERVEHRKANSIFLRGDNRTDISANASLHKLA